MRAFLAVLAFVAAALPLLPASAAEAEPEVVIEFFWSETCPHCHAEWEFLAELAEDHPDVVIAHFEVSRDPANVDRFVAVMAEHGMEPVGVPTTVVGEQVWVGFDPVIGEEIRAAVAGKLTSTGTPVSSEEVDLPFVGPVEVGSASLLVSTVLIALVDGVNPCSLWVLSILLALVLRGGSRRRVVMIGGTFLAVTTLLYGVYVAGMYGALSVLVHQEWVRVAMAVVALTFGVINLKDYFWSRRGVSLTIPEKSKPALYRRIRHVAASAESLPLALGGTALLAVGVSLLETPCTAGYPLLWADLLAAQGVGLAGAAPLFAVYMGVFLVDELVVFGAAALAMRTWKLEERGGRVLKLVAGMVMVALAGTLILAPGAMTSVGGAVAVFGAAAAAAAAVVAVDRIRGGSARRPGRPAEARTPIRARRR